MLLILIIYFCNLTTDFQLKANVGLITLHILVGYY